MHRAWILIPLLLVIPIFLQSCGSEPAPPPDPEVPEAGDAMTPDAELGDPEPAPPGQTEEPDPGESANDSQPVTLETKSWDETLDLIKNHRGKVVVMDLWSTTCPPCLRELPHLVELAKDQPDDVECISVSLDYAGFEDEPVESYRESVLEWLNKFDADIQNILCSTVNETIFSEKIPHASLPVVLVYDQSGKLAQEFPDPKDPAEFTYQDDVVPLVTKLIGK